MGDSESLGAKGGVGELLLAAATTAFLVPGFFALRYPHELALDAAFVMGLSLVLFVAIASALWMIVSFLGWFDGGVVAGRFARFCLAWALLTGFVSPLIRSGGMTEADAAPTSWFNGAFSLVISLIFAWKVRSPGPGLLLTATALAPLVCLSAILNTTRGEGSTATGLARLGELSARDNVIVLSFDGIPGHLVQELIEARDPLIGEFRDFTWFADAVSTSPATTASMLSELFGNRDFRSVASTESQLLSKLDWSTLFFNGTDDDVRLYGVGAYEAANPERHVRLPRVSAPGSRFFSTVSFLNIAVARTGSNQAARLVRALAGRLDAAVGPATLYRGPSWKEPLLADRAALDALILSLRTGEAMHSIRLMHFVHTHYPPDLDRHGVLRGSEPGWQEKNRNPAALLDQTRFALSQASRFLEALRKLGIYDRTLVVIKSDHGEPPEFFDRAPWNLRIRGNPLWGYCRYRPLLLLKAKGVRAAKMRTDRRMVTLGDLAKTLCNARANPAKDCSAFPGLDLMSDSRPSGNDRWYFVEVVRNAESGFRFEDHETVRLDRTRGFLDQLLEKELVTD